MWLNVGSVYKIENEEYLIIESTFRIDHNAGGFGTYFYKAIPVSELPNMKLFNFIETNKNIISFTDSGELFKDIKLIKEDVYDVRSWNVTEYSAKKKEVKTYEK